MEHSPRTLPIFTASQELRVPTKWRQPLSCFSGLIYYLRGTSCAEPTPPLGLRVTSFEALLGFDASTAPKLGVRTPGAGSLWMSFRALSRTAPFEDLRPCRAERSLPN